MGILERGGGWWPQPHTVGMDRHRFAPAAARCACVTCLFHRAQGKTAYKVQEMCFEYAQSEWEPSDEWDARIIDACACSREMERKNVLDVFAVELRNRLLAQLGIPEE